MRFSSERRTISLLVSSLAKWQVKFIFAFLAFVIIIAVFLFTQSIVNELLKREQDAVVLYAKILGDFLDTAEKPTNSSDIDIFLFFLNDIQETMINFPVIVTYENGDPSEPFDDWTLNVKIDPELTIKQQRGAVLLMLNKMKESYQPILVKDKKGKIIQKVYYTHSALVDKLRFFPFIGLIVIGVFIIIGYISFNSSRDNEQSKVWVGMAKEAAHQLGTPLSSMLAWLEIIKFSSDDPQAVNETAAEMEKDIQRLNTIAIRFSKIGSTPDKELVNISKLIDNVCNYYDKRLPHLGKKIEIIRSLDDRMFAEVNVDLFAWVIENLLKNGAEAIEEKTGQIYIFMRVNSKKKIFIFVKDTGKGMSQKLKRQIFTPGFTTKRRGWGLGLSLCKRIVEEYHDGKIYVKETIPGKGTTFAIEIPVKESN
jgi:nitrogen-specific signal transduction histidine kinase